MEDVKNVWSVTTNGKNDCVVMSDAEVMLVKLKFTGTHNIEMYNMTERLICLNICINSTYE